MHLAISFLRNIAFQMTVIKCTRERADINRAARKFTITFFVLIFCCWSPSGFLIFSPLIGSHVNCFQELCQFACETKIGKQALVLLPNA